SLLSGPFPGGGQRLLDVVVDRHDLVQADELDDAGGRRAAQGKAQLAAAGGGQFVSARERADSGGVPEGGGGHVGRDQLWRLADHGGQQVTDVGGVRHVHLGGHGHHRVPTRPANAPF